MRWIPPHLSPEPNRKRLRQLLQDCRSAARMKQHFQIASISLTLNYIAPSAVLQSICKPGDLHFYIERTQAEEAVVAAGGVVQARPAGSTRFAETKAFADEILENTIAVGDLSHPFTGPHFFTAFTFDESVGEESPFPAATVFLPRWQVGCSKGKYSAVANLKVEADTDIDALFKKVWAAYERFTSFDYTGRRSQSSVPKPQIQSYRKSFGSAYPDAVRRALKAIESGAYEKIVLARKVRLEADRPWDTLDTLTRLRECFPECFTFSFCGGNPYNFIGATPERLLRIRNGRLLTEVIAGSAPRGADAGEDARYARELLESSKDLHEHICVRDSILRRLRKVGIHACAESHPQLLQLSNVQHLRTRIEAEIGKSADLPDILAEMYPTPAVGGSPREAAVPHIAGFEQIERGLYAGIIGWFNHLNEGEMVVGIRSALIKDTCAYLYAGAGIVKGSDPDKEMRETELKLQALLNVLTRT